jgi:hypothetical protein
LLLQRQMIVALVHGVTRRRDVHESAAE